MHTYTGTYSFSSLFCSSVRTSFMRRVNSAEVQLRCCVRGQRLSDSSRSPIIPTVSLPIWALTGSTPLVNTSASWLSTRCLEIGSNDQGREGNQNKWDCVHLCPNCQWAAVWSRRELLQALLRRRDAAIVVQYEGLDLFGSLLLRMPATTSSQPTDPSACRCLTGC